MNWRKVAGGIAWAFGVICANVGVYIAYGVPGIIGLFVGQIIGYSAAVREQSRRAELHHADL